MICGKGGRVLQRVMMAYASIFDYRNNDEGNPRIFIVQHPDPMRDERYKICLSCNEPYFLDLLLNTVWWCLNPTSPYYKKALKLRSVQAPQSMPQLKGLSGLRATWTEVHDYLDCFDEQLEVDGPVTGPQGFQGPVGLDGSQEPWDILKTYMTGQIVSFGGNTYASLIDGNASRPDLPTHWMRLTEIGDEPVPDLDAIEAEALLRLHVTLIASCPLPLPPVGVQVSTPQVGEWHVFLTFSSPANQLADAAYQIEYRESAQSQWLVATLNASPSMSNVLRIKALDSMDAASRQEAVLQYEFRASALSSCGGYSPSISAHV